MKAGDVSRWRSAQDSFRQDIDRRPPNEHLLAPDACAAHPDLVNEITSEADAKAKIDRLKDRLDAGAKFEDMARLNSEDASSAKGGDLGWVSPGDTVPVFEEAMNKLALNQVSAPVRTPFGWHLIEVSGRRKQDVSADRARMQAQLAIRQRRPTRPSRTGPPDARPRVCSKCGATTAKRYTTIASPRFCETIVASGRRTPAFAGIYAPQSSIGATKVG